MGQNHSNGNNQDSQRQTSMARGASRNAGNNRNETERPGLGRYHLRVATRRGADSVMRDSEQATGSLLDESYRVHRQPANSGSRSHHSYDELAQGRDEHLVFDVEMHEAAEYNEAFQEDESAYFSQPSYFYSQQPSGNNGTLSSDNTFVSSSTRVLRMTPARRRRQTSNPFYLPTASSNQSRVSANRPSSRLQRILQAGAGNEISQTRQTDSVPSRRNHAPRHSSSSDGPDGIPRRPYWGSFVASDTSGNMDRASPSVSDNEPFTSLRSSDRSRGRYSEPDVWRFSRRHDSPSRQQASHPSSSFNSNLAGASSASSTQTESSTTSGQSLRRRLTRVATRRFFGRGDGGSSAVDGNDTVDPLDNSLARLLSIAASLVVGQEDTIEGSQLGNAPRDLGLEGTLTALLRARRSTEPSATTVTVDEQAPQTARQPGSFLHIFRMGSSQAATLHRSITDPIGSVSEASVPTVGDTATSSNNSRDASGGSGNSNSSHMVPVIIVGIQSVPQRDASDEVTSQSGADSNQQRSDMGADGHSDTSFASRNPFDRSTASTGTHTASGRSLIIYVLSGSYPSTHPFVSTPSLFTENPTYEDLMLLTSLLGPARPVTTTQGEIDACLPTALYDASISGVRDFEILGNSEKCQVCLCDYVQGDTLRVLSCHHGFHRECIDKWLTEGSNKCPICRGEGVPSSTSSNQGGTMPVAATPDQGN